MSTKGVMDDVSMRIGSGSQLLVRHSSLKVPDAVFVPPQRRPRTPRMAPGLPIAQTESEELPGQCTLAKDYTAVPMNNVALPGGHLRVVPWAPSGAARRKYQREIH